MQKAFLKIALAVFGLLLSLNSVQGQSPTQQLARADSLFNIKKYTQSLEVYTELVDKKIFSTAMLLRMAFIEEGLMHKANALYYLNLYYQYTFDEAAIRKIQEIAEANRFTGYEQTDLDKLEMAWRKHGYLVTLVLVVVAVVFTVLLVVSNRNRKAHWAAQSFCFALLLIHLNFPFKEKAIIKQGTAYLMSGPSAGSSVVAVIGEGNRVTVLGREDVWVKVLWQDREVYVRESNVKAIKI
ncbi:MAG: SH3 domain-containing protein [Flammeovirgaceae bacterium]|nr:MAG: SH3 domain-containing protein [Flammeovirgaceae bacterium]